MALTWTKKLQNIPLLKPLFGYGQQKPPVVVGLPEEGDPGGPSTAWDFYQARMKLAADRLATYHEFEVMDEDDVIVAALDLYAEEATQPDMIKGRVVWAESDNEDLQEILNNLLESLDMDMEAFAICREMCLYGDSFSAILQTVRDDKAPGPIVGLKALDPKDIHRHEDKLGRLQGFSRGHTPDPEKISKPWDYIHFRLLGKSRISRYGTGVLFPARKVYRMLRLMEDSMAIYRLKRVPGRLAFGLTGLQGLPFERRFSVINRVRREMSKRMFIDPTQSKVAQEVNPLCFTGDTIIPLLDGRKLSMEQIASEFGIREKSFWVYSYDKDTGRVVPGKAVCLGITGKNAKLVEIELDSGEKLRCTPEHKWMLRNGEYCEAKDLAAGDSLMPLQANHKVVAVRFVDEREDVYDICVEKHHNFALEAGVFVSNSVDENVYYDSSSVNITNLPGVAGNDRPYDIEYMKKRLFMCLRIPPDYLGQAEARGGLLAQSPLAHQEVQFARQCKRIQGAFVAGIVRLCQIHMAWCGIDPLEEKNEFKIGVQPISYLEEMERSNLTRIRAETIILLEQIGQALDLDKTAWLDYVFKLSGFPEDIIESSKPEGSVEAPVQGDVALSKEEQRVHDVVKNNKLVESILGRLIPEAVPGGQSSKASRINRSELPNKKDV